MYRLTGTLYTVCLRSVTLGRGFVRVFTLNYIYTMIFHSKDIDTVFTLINISEVYERPFVTNETFSKKKLSLRVRLAKCTVFAYETGMTC